MQVHHHQCGARGVVLMTTKVQQTTGQNQNGGNSTLGNKKRAEMPLPPILTTSSRRAKATTIGSGPPLEKGGSITVTEKIENANQWRAAFRAESFDDEIVRLGFLIARKDMQLAVLGLAYAWLREVLTPQIVEGILLIKE